jgi:hypothetical protein
MSMLHSVIVMMIGGSSDSGPTILWDSTDKTANMTLSNGDLTASASHATDQYVRTTFKNFSTGDSTKVCGQFTIDAVNNNIYLGIVNDSASIASLINGSSAFAWNSGSGISSNNWTESGVGVTPWSASDTIDWALDCPGGRFFLGRNGTWFNSSDPVAGTNASFTNMQLGNFALFVGLTGALADTVSIVPRASVTLSLSGYTNVGG